MVSTKDVPEISSTLTQNQFGPGDSFGLSITLAYQINSLDHISNLYGPNIYKIVLMTDLTFEGKELYIQNIQISGALP